MLFFYVNLSNLITFSLYTHKLQIEINKKFMQSAYNKLYTSQIRAYNKPSIINIVSLFFSLFPFFFISFFFFFLSEN